MARTRPNIIVTGTPGVGKTSHCEELAGKTGLEHCSINKIVKERGCHDGWDQEHQSFIVDEDKLLDSLEDEVPQGGFIIDWHACDLFPRRWVDLVVVLRTDSTILYDRLKVRNYPNAKIQENLDSEIMEVLLAEARESYDDDIVWEMRSNKIGDMEENLEKIESWIKEWSNNHTESAEEES